MRVFRSLKNYRAGEGSFTVWLGRVARNLLIDDYRKTNRGGKGIKAFNRTDKNGDICEQLLVKPDDEIMVISSKGIVIRTRVFEIRETGRAAQGVRVMKIEEGDMVIDAANSFTIERSNSNCTDAQPSGSQLAPLMAVWTAP